MTSRICIILALLLGLFCPKTHAQSISVSKFLLAEHDMSAIDNPVIDQNGNKCALIRVQTTQKGFVFDVGSLGVKKVDDTKVGEIWVYVPAGVKHIDVRHQELGNAEQYYFPVSIQAARTYRLELETNAPDVQVLNIKYSPANAVVVIDGDMIDGEDGHAEITLPVGEHTYKIIAKGYFQQDGSIFLSKESISNLIVELDRNSDVEISSSSRDIKKAKKIDPVEEAKQKYYAQNNVHTSGELLPIITGFSELYNIEWGKTTTDDISAKFGGKLKNNFGFEMWVLKDGTELYFSHNKIIESLHIYPREIKSRKKFPIQSSYLSWNSNLSDWEQFLTSNNIALKKKNEYCLQTAYYAIEGGIISLEITRKNVLRKQEIAVSFIEVSF